MYNNEGEKLKYSEIVQYFNEIRKGEHFMANKSNILRNDVLLKSDDYLASENGLYYAYLQDDGNLVVYRGSGPDDEHGALWNTGRHADLGPDFYAVVQEDGNFVIYAGTDPDHRKKAVWNSGRHADLGPKFFLLLGDDGHLMIYRGTGPNDRQGDLVWSSDAYDGVVDIAEIYSIDYDTKNATKQSTQDVQVFHQEVNNPTGAPMSQDLKFSKTVTTESSWSNSLAISAGISATFTAGVPELAGGEVQVSLNITATYETSGSVTTTEELDFDVPLTIQPHTDLVCDVTCSKYIINVPYTLKGTLVFKSGAKMPGLFTGTYTGGSETDFKTVYTENPATKQVKTTTKAIKPTQIRNASH